MRDRRYRVGQLGGERILHVRGSDQFGGQVWLNNVNDFDGVLLARGDTRSEAIERATKFLVEALEQLAAAAKLDQGEGEK